MRRDQGEKLGDRLEQAIPLALRAHRRGGSQVWLAPQQIRYQLYQFGTPAHGDHVTVQVFLRTHPREPTQRLDERLVGHQRLSVVPSHQDGGSARGAHLRERQRERCLAHARLACHEHKLAPARLDARPRVRELGKLGRPAVQLGTTRRLQREVAAKKPEPCVVTAQASHHGCVSPPTPLPERAGRQRRAGSVAHDPLTGTARSHCGERAGPDRAGPPGDPSELTRTTLPPSGHGRGVPLQPSRRAAPRAPRYRTGGLRARRAPAPGPSHRAFPLGRQVHWNR